MTTEILIRVIPVQCHRCFYNWNYTGKTKSNRVSCPNCRTTVTFYKLQTEKTNKSYFKTRNKTGTLSFGESGIMTSSWNDFRTGRRN